MNAFKHFCRYLLGVDQPSTQVTARELSVLLSHSSSAGTLVEIGCYEGATTVALAANTPSGQVYSIDPFPGGRIGVCYSYWIVRMQMSRKRVRNIRLIKALSHEAAPHFDSPIDFLFIDGDHTWQGIERDWTDWFPKVAAGGVIALHDCRVSTNSPVELGSMKFYRERLAELNTIIEVDGVDSLVVFKKVN